MNILDKSKGGNIYDLVLARLSYIWCQKHDPQKYKLINWPSLKLRLSALWKALLREWQDKWHTGEISSNDRYLQNTHKKKWAGKLFGQIL